MKSSQYPYIEAQRKCKFIARKVFTKVENVYQLYDGKVALSYGPVPAIVDSSNFKNYAGGIFNEYCSTSINHSVTVVGWSVDYSDGSEYWIIRNSWGNKFGEEGHIRIKIGGHCPVFFLTHPSVSMW
jgi:C1A family cysteine protease